MVLESLDTKFSSNVPADIHVQIQALNNRLLLKRLHRSAIQSKDIEGFRSSIEELTKEERVLNKATTWLLRFFSMQHPAIHTDGEGPQNVRKQSVDRSQAFS